MTDPLTNLVYLQEAQLRLEKGPLYRDLKTKRGKMEQLMAGARRRAIKQGLAFNLDWRDLQYPDFCPVLGIELCYTNEIQMLNSPSLDRIIPHLGYVKGNVVTISMRANSLKSNAYPEEIKAIYEYLQKAGAYNGVGPTREQAEAREAQLLIDELDDMLR